MKNTSTAGLYRFFALLALASAVGLFAVGGQDVALAQKIYRANAGFGLFFEAFGFWPAYLPVAFTGAYLFWFSKRDLLRACGAFLAVGTASALWYLAFHYFVKAGRLLQVPASGVLLLGLGTAVLLLGITAKLQGQQRFALKMACFAGLSYLALHLAAVQTLKWVFGRARYFDLLAQGSLAGFTPWYLPQGPTGNTSFPSGHVAAAAAVFAVVLYAVLANKSKLARALSALASLLFVALTALGRMQLGRHFASDTLAAVCISALVWLAVLQILHMCAPPKNTRGPAQHRKRKQ